MITGVAMFKPKTKCQVIIGYGKETTIFAAKTSIIHIKIIENS